MAFWNRKENWEDQYDEYYTRDIERGGNANSKFRYVPHVAALIAVGGLFLGAIGVVSGRTMLEKVATALASPVGIIWLSLIVMIYFSLLNRRSWPAIMGLVCWVTFTVFGNGYVADSLANSLESKWQSVDVFSAEPWDVIVVLGGGTGTQQSGNVQVSTSGDRVVLAARLYHSGLAKTIICTGKQSYRTSKEDLNPYEEAARLLTSLDVPSVAILKLGGENTSQEMANLKKWMDSQTGDQRVGIVTSARHLNRALRLAKSQGITAEGIPADFLSLKFAPAADLIVPSGWNLHVSALIVKEYLAGLIGR